MRAHLLFNPHATTTDTRVRDVIAAALASEVDLVIQPTKQRGHATHLAAGAVHEGADLVVVLGGDGTVNEAIQGLAGADVALGVAPGGGTNVLARALGLPNDPVAATGQMLEALRDRRFRRVSLGTANGRYFAFSAGFGYDAAVVRRVEQSPGLKRRLRQLSFVGLAVREWAFGAERRRPGITAHVPGEPPFGPFLVAVAGNADPYTYLGPRPMRVTPEASFEAGLDLLGVPPATTLGVLRVVWGSFRGGRHVDLSPEAVGGRLRRGRPGRIVHRHDLAGFRLEAAAPAPLMVDGDYAGEHMRVTFRSVPSALRVLV